MKEGKCLKTMGCSRGAKGSRSEVENPEGLWEARLAKWGGGG